MKNILPQLRTQYGWTQADLASRLGVSRQSVNAIETERYEPSLSLAFTIARLFGKPVEEIFLFVPGEPGLSARNAGGAQVTSRSPISAPAPPQAPAADVPSGR